MLTSASADQVHDETSLNVMRSFEGGSWGDPIFVELTTAEGGSLWDVKLTHEQAEDLLTLLTRVLEAY